MTSNKLINESSPYLLQHANNPVNWFPWGDEALQKAKEEDKLLIISIGYSSCHWCHVMEHESFEDEMVADLMNEHFISIKVDREERPDIDQIYMEAAQLISGNGGWPLNAIALPDGRPIYAGTYFPKENWMQLLRNVQAFYENQRDKALDQAERLTNGVKGMELDLEPSGLSNYNDQEIQNIVDAMMPGLDFKMGGQKGAPKFPMPVGLEFLMKYQHFEGDLVIRKFIETTLDKMAFGGIYDAVGGGFARYSVDDIWKVPHFEKMLYDNAQLIALYSKAYRIFDKKEYQLVVEQSIEFLDREMSGGDSQYYSALDADSEGEEGKFYVWTFEEWYEALGKDAELFADVFSIEEKGNWEHGVNVLIREKSWKEIAEARGMTEEEILEKWSDVSNKLLEKRSERVRPGLDDKALTSWNAMMITALCEAYRSFKNPEYKDKAEATAKYIIEKMMDKDGSLLRNYKDGKASINAFLDDYAFTIQAFIDLYEITMNEEYLGYSISLLKHCETNFNDEKSELFYYTSSKDPELITRKKEIADNVIASSNSAMANNLYRLGKLYDNADYQLRAEKMLAYVRNKLPKYGYYYSNWSGLLIDLNYGMIELAIMGDNAEKYLMEIDNNYLPSCLRMASTNISKLPLLENKMISDQTTIYVCRNKVCDLPVQEVDQAINQIRKIQLGD